MEIEKDEANEEHGHPLDHAIKSQTATQSITRKINKYSSISLSNEEKNNKTAKKIGLLYIYMHKFYIFSIEIKRNPQGEPTEEKDNISIDEDDLNSSQNSERRKTNKKQSKAKSVFQNASNNLSNSKRYSIENTELISSYKVKPNQEELICTQNNTCPTNEPKKKRKSNSVLILAEDRRKEEIYQKRKTNYNPSSLKQTSESQFQLNTLCNPKEEDNLDASIDQEEEIEIKKTSSPLREKSKSISTSRKMNEEQSIKQNRCTTTATYDRNMNDDNKFLIEKKNRLISLKQENNDEKQSNSSASSDENSDEQDDTDTLNIQNKGPESHIQQKKNSTCDDKERIIESEEVLYKRNQNQDENSKNIKKTRGKSNSISFSALSKEKEAFDKRLKTIQKEEKDWKKHKFEKNSQNAVYHEYDGEKDEEKSLDRDQDVIYSEEEIENHGVDIRKEMKTKEEQSKSIVYNSYSDDKKPLLPVHKRYSMIEKNVVVDGTTLQSLAKDDLKGTSKMNNSSSKASNQKSISIFASPDSNLSDNNSIQKRYTTYENNKNDAINLDSDKKITHETAILTSEARKQSIFEKKTKEEGALEPKAKSDKKRENQRLVSKSIIMNEKLGNEKDKKRYTTIDKNDLNEFQINSFIIKKEENQEKELSKDLEQSSIDKNDEKDQEYDVEESEIIPKKMINKTKYKSIAFSSTDAKIEELKKQKKRLTTYEKVKFEMNSNEIRNEEVEYNQN